MLIVLDIGNTNIKIGLFNNDEIVTSWRISVKPHRTADEYFATILELFSSNNLSVNEVSGVIISSVVPMLNYTMEHMFRYYFNIKPLMVSAQLNTGLTFDYVNKEELGADRIANAVAVRHIFGVPAIIVDLGTATTIGAIDKNGCFRGGAIAPGLKSSVDSLSNNAAKLRMVELVKPEHVIGRTTAENMQTGAIYGFTGLVERLVKEIKKELNEDNVKVIATGGLTQLIVDDDIFDVVDRALTLKGLKILYDLNVNTEEK